MPEANHDPVPVPVSPSDLRAGDVLWRDGRIMIVTRCYVIDNGWIVEWKGPGTGSGVFSVLSGNSVDRVRTRRWVSGNSGADWRADA